MNLNKKIAVFFDCENISAKYIDDIFDELANYGDVIIKQAYRDWSSKHHRAWYELLNKYAIKPIQTNANIQGKNASDIQIVIDVMNALSEAKVDSIALVSSDSDFTTLAIEIKAKAFEVLGFGEEKTPDSLRNAYSTFIQLPIETQDDTSKDDSALISILKDGIAKTKDENGYALVSQIGNYLKNKNASYHAKNFGANTWGEIFKKHSDIFGIKYKDGKHTMIVKVLGQ
ncbi:MAG: NYN domain-containing protein [Campylobacterota bacterium]